MNGETKTIGTEQWKEASKTWRIYAYNPASRNETKAESLSSRVPVRNGAPSVSESQSETETLTPKSLE